jgi:hypothetical protein
LAAVAAATAGAGVFTAAAPAAAAPGNCTQWAFSGPTNVKLSTGPTVVFDAVGRSFAGLPDYRAVIT